MSNRLELSSILLNFAQLRSAVFYCLQLSPIVSNCVQLSPTVLINGKFPPNSPQLFTIVCNCLQLSVIAPNCLQMSSFVSICAHISPIVLNCFRFLVLDPIWSALIYDKFGNPHIQKRRTPAFSTIAHKIRRMHYRDKQGSAGSTFGNRRAGRGEIANTPPSEGDSLMAYFLTPFLPNVG